MNISIAVDLLNGEISDDTIKSLKNLRDAEDANFIFITEKKRYELPVSALGNLNWTARKEPANTDGILFAISGNQILHELTIPYLKSFYQHNEIQSEIPTHVRALLISERKHGEELLKDVINTDVVESHFVNIQSVKEADNILYIKGTINSAAYENGARLTAIYGGYCYDAEIADDFVQSIKSFIFTMPLALNAELKIYIRNSICEFLPVKITFGFIPDDAQNDTLYASENCFITNVTDSSFETVTFDENEIINKIFLSTRDESWELSSNVSHLLNYAIATARKKIKTNECINFNNEYKPAIISIIVPVYNGEAHLPETLESLLNQTFQDIEIICIDDCSEDSTATIIREYAEKDPRVKGIFFSENKTASLARKAGVLMSKGAYILFVDGDDTIDETACETMLAAMTESNVDVLHFNAQIINCTEMPENRISYMKKFVSPHPGELRDTDLVLSCFEERKFCFTLWSKLYRAQICKMAFLHVDDTPLPKAQDMYAAFLIYLYSKSYKGLPELYLYNYNFGRGNTGHEAMGLERFELYCSMARVYNAFWHIFINYDLECVYSGMLEKLKGHLLTDCVANWHRLKAEDRPRGFERMLTSWGTETIIPYFAAKKWYQRVSMTNDIFSNDFLPHNKRKIKTIGTFYYNIKNGGAQRVVVKLCEYWLNMGYNVVLFTDTGKTDDDYPLPRGVKHVQWPDSVQHVSAKYLERCRAICASMRTHEIDVMVYQPWVSTSALWDMLTIKSLGIPFVMHTHNIFSAFVATQFPYFGEMPYIYRFFDYTVTLTRVDEMYWSNHCKRVIYTSNPFTFSLDDITPGNLSGLNILWLGRLSKEKNPLDAIEIMKRVAVHVPEAVLHVVGDNPQSNYLQSMKKRTADYRLENNIVFHGFHKDVKEFYRQASVFLMTSQHEGFPMTLVESSSFGLPCVSYDMPYLEMHRDGRGLIRVPQGDIEAAADAVVSLLLDEQRRTELGKDARTAAEDMNNFDIKGVWRKIFTDLEIGNTDNEHSYSYSPETSKILFETLAIHSEMGSQIQHSRQKELSDAKKIIADLRK
ncbi:MAG: glycosyltransferase [Defluviitaleaceae bacterium]|nr:glycosyltransferase [Defluviitaleaceae bacterium]